MVISYYEAPDVAQLVETVVRSLGFTYIDPKRVFCFRSKGSKSRRTVARLHSLEKLWQKALRADPQYLIEVISERYDNLSRPDQEKVVIHELLHIPKGFSGGFRPHKGWISRKTINTLHKNLHRNTSELDEARSERLMK